MRSQGQGHSPKGKVTPGLCIKAKSRTAPRTEGGFVGASRPKIKHIPKEVALSESSSDGSDLELCKVMEQIEYQSPEAGNLKSQMKNNSGKKAVNRKKVTNRKSKNGANTKNRSKLTKVKQVGQSYEGSDSD